MIIEYTVDTIYGAKTILAEIQIRTWLWTFGRQSNIQLTINIKEISQRKSRKESLRLLGSRISHQLDEEMSKIRADIQEANKRSWSFAQKVKWRVGNSDDTDEVRCVNELT